MTTDYKALCAQLADDLQEARDAVSDWAAYASEHFKQKHDLQGELGRIQRQIDRARAALAQPEPVGPISDLTPADLSHLDDKEFVSLCPQGYHATGGFEPYEPTDEELNDTYWKAWHEHLDRANSVLHAAGLRAVLARWGRPAITPIPVSERLPGPEDCDAEGRCWAWDWLAVCWRDVSWEEVRRWADTHWLPATALPLPTSDHH